MSKKIIYMNTKRESDIRTVVYTLWEDTDTEEITMDKEICEKYKNRTVTFIDKISLSHEELADAFDSIFKKREQEE